MEWSRSLRKVKTGELRKSYVYWHMPNKERLKFGWKDKDELVVRIKFGSKNHHEQSIALTSGGSFRIAKDVAARLEQLAKRSNRAEVTFLVSAPETIDKLYEAFTQEINRSLESSSKDRNERLKIASEEPAMHLALISVRKRNADVVAEVLDRANGKCEVCGKTAPFRREDGRYYLEVHHKIWLAHHGLDNVKNAIALCPNCHREAHFGQKAEWRNKLSRASILE